MENMNARPSTLEVCLQCGDVGFANAYIYCVKCLKFVVHRYCLNVIPKSFDEFAPWLCDDCEAENRNQHPLLKTLPTSTKKNETLALTVENHVPSESDSDCDTVGLGMKDEVMRLSAADERKRCDQSNSQLLVEETIKDNLLPRELSADTSQQDSAEDKRSANVVSIIRENNTVCNNSLDRPYKESTNFSFNDRAKLAGDSTLSNDVDRIKSLKRENGIHHESDPQTASAPPPFSLNSRSEGSLKKKRSDMPSSANLKDHTTPFPQNFKKQEGLVGIPCTDINLSREPEVTKDRIPASNQSYSFNGFQKDLSLSAEPVMESIWRGSFNIVLDDEDDILEDMMAHLSISACQKVYNEARQFKPVLNLEMLPRADVWPQSFEKSESICQNIALYFFPSERCELIYDYLVNQMVEEELALKAIVKNAELLVFPSTKLPLSYWRFKGKYYLWGVFREKQIPASRSASCEREPRYSPAMRRNGVDDNSGSISVAAMKNFGGVSPLSPLSNCSSYGSRTS